MKPIIGLIVLMALVTEMSGQPLDVEWTREIRINNDSLQGFSPISILEQSWNQSLFVFGKARSRSSHFDSSSAVILNLSPEGDSLWTRMYEDSVHRLESFGSAAELSTGEFVTARYLPGLYFVDLDGNLFDSTFYQCDANWISEYDAVIAGPDDQIYVAARCVQENDTEAANITCISELGDSLWSISRAYERYNWVVFMSPRVGGGILAVIGEDSYAGRKLLEIDRDGNVLHELEMPFYLQGAVSIAQDTLIAIGYASGSELLVEKVLSDGSLLADATFDLPSPLGIMKVTSVNRRVQIQLASSITEFSFDLEILWHLQLPEGFGYDGIRKQNGGYLGMNVTYDEGVEVPLFTSYLSPELPFYSMNSTLDFGLVPIGESVTMELEIGNPGAVGTIQSIHVPDGFSVSPQSPIVVHTDELVALSITFSPPHLGGIVDTLFIDSDPTLPPLKVVLSARGITAIDEMPNTVPTVFALAAPYPNPFNPATNLTFQLPKDSRVTLAIFDIQGRFVDEVVNGQFTAGTHTVSWSCPDCATGLYFAKLNAGANSATQKLLLLK